MAEKPAKKTTGGGAVQFWCCVPSCVCQRKRDNTKKTNLGFFLVPDPKKHKTIFLKNLAKKRLKRWREAIGSKVRAGARICEWHFLYGKPASLTSTRDVDWVPSRYLESSTRERWTAEQLTAGDTTGESIDQPHSEIDSADEMEPLVETAAEDEPTEEAAEEDDQPDEEPEGATIETSEDEHQDEDEPEEADPETVVEAVLEDEPAEEVDLTGVEEEEATEQHVVESTEQPAEPEVAEDSDDDSVIACEETYEEIRPNEGNENNGELIGIDRDDHGSDTCVQNLCGEIEVKEEPPEIESYTDPMEDPIMGMPAPIKQEDSDDMLADTTDQVRDNTGRKGGKESTSDTETADEGEDCVVLTVTPIDEHAYHASPAAHSKPQLRQRVVRKKQPTKPTAPSPYLPRNVRNFLHTRKSTHTCLECQGQFFSVVEYLKHRKRHPKIANFPYQCRYCPTRFRLHRDMLPHLLTHSKLEKFTCPMCPTQVFSAHKLVIHMQVHRSSPKENYYFKCVTCSVRFSKCKQLEEHNLVSHPKFVNGVPVKPTVVNTSNFEPKNPTRTVHVCFHCGKVESTWPELLIHMRIHKGPLACTICLISLKTSDEFAEHVVKVHKDMGELTYHQCKNPSCPREFISPRELKQHEATCLPMGGEYRCEICDQLYREVDHFVTHMELHSMLSNELGHKQCPHCVFPTSDPGDFAAHLVNLHGYRDRVETLEYLYAEYMRGEESSGTSSPGSDSEEEDEDDDDYVPPNKTEQEKRTRHSADEVVLDLECE